MSEKNNKEKHFAYGMDADLDLKLIITLNRCLQNIKRREYPLIKKAGLTMPQFGVLELLYHKGPFKINQIIKKTLSTGGNMTVVIDNLVKRELVKRVNCTEDRRSQYIEITATGTELIKDLFPRHVEDISNLTSVLSKNEKEQFIMLAKKLGKELEKQPDV